MILLKILIKRNYFWQDTCDRRFKPSICKCHRQPHKINVIIHFWVKEWRFRKINDVPKTLVRTEGQVCSWFQVCKVRVAKGSSSVFWPNDFQSVLPSVSVLLTQFIFWSQISWSPALNISSEHSTFVFWKGTCPDISMVSPYCPQHVCMTFKDPIVLSTFKVICICLHY